MIAFPRPDPQNDDDALFWNALRDGELRIQRCIFCATFRHPARPVCANCGERGSEFVRVAGTGEIWSFTVIHPPTLPAFADRTPYAAIVVRLDERIFLVSNLIDCPPDEITIGAPVELAITQIDHDLFLPLFRASRPS